eukprot:4079093-Amphidinium_carterae.1
MATKRLKQLIQEEQLELALERCTRLRKKARQGTSAGSASDARMLCYERLSRSGPGDPPQERHEKEHEILK